MTVHEVLWTPGPEQVQAATMTAYARWLERTRGLTLGDYDALWRWSTEEVGPFWDSIVDYFELDFGHHRPTTALATEQMPGAVWFPGAELNFAQHVFRNRDPEAVVLQHASELRTLSAWTWADLTRETALIQSRLQALGVGLGDRVAAYMPNIPETLAAFLATAALGAIWSSAAPEFGARAVIDRFSQIEPTVLLAVDGYRYGGKDFDRRALVSQIAEAIPSAPALITYGYLDGTGWEPAASGTPGGVPEPAVGNTEITFVPVRFEHPLWILFSSGTTGLPKPIVHSQGGILIEHAKNAGLHLDARAGDNVFWFTTTGWMMWNLLVGVLLSEASITLFDGNPGYPDLTALWVLAAEAKITTFGTSAAYINSCMKAGIEPARERDLSRLKAIGSTGSPLSGDGFHWIYEHVGADTWLFSTSGGTDVCTAFVGGVPTLPVREGELQARCLGAAIEAWDPDGNALVAEVGELVLTRPMPSMPVFLWGDADGSRLLDSYFSMYPGIWRHGDWIEITPEGGAIIHGRSDSTINRGGVRIGTAEIYTAVLALDDVADALVVDLPSPETDGRIELFVTWNRPVDDQALADLAATIRRRIREDCSPRHVPDDITSVARLPRTLSGKLLEVPVKRILMGEDPDRVVSRDSLADPEALDDFIALARQRLAETASDGS
jgi:acetoacetyl-CoA synthetase